MSIKWPSLAAANDNLKFKNHGLNFEINKSDDGSNEKDNDDKDFTFHL